MKIKITTWNCCGLLKGTKLLRFLNQHLDYSDQETLRVFCFQEVKTEVLSEEICSILKLNFFNYHFMPSTGRSGGLLTFWNSKLTFKRTSSTDSCIVTTFIDLNLCILNTYIKTSEYTKACQLLCDSITNIENVFEKNIVLLGDFAFSNLKRDRAGKNCEGTVTKDMHIQIFKRLSPILSIFLMDDVALKFGENRFTHKCKKTGTQTRIDYIFSNILENFSDVKTIATELSDHHCVEGTLKIGDNLDVGCGVWRLNNNILLNNHETIKELLLELKIELNNYDEQKQRLRDVLRSIRINKKRIDSSYKQNLLRSLKEVSCEEERCRLHQMLKDLEQKEAAELLTVMKNTVKEACNGNPKAVKRWVKCCQPKTLIHELLLPNGAKTTNTDEMLSEFSDYYKDLYTDNEPDSLHRFEVMRYYNKKISDEERNFLAAKITRSEVESAINSLNIATSPGPDGLTAELYLYHRKTFSTSLCPVFQAILDGKEFPFSFYNAIIKLLPKQDEIKDASGFRPINLINTDQKIFSHLIANRFKQVLALIIESDQYAYLPGRNIHVAINDLKSRVDSLMDEECVISVDFSKAFDRVDRVYLFHILRKMNFPENIVRTLERLYSKTQAHISVNGYLTERIRLRRGVRQGCPLSALLFIVALEPLLDILRNHPWSNYAVPRRVVAYADDVTVFLHKIDIDNLFSKIKFFCRGTQFKVNRKKSQVLCADERVATASKIKILGLYHGLTSEAYEENIKLLEEILSDSEKYFTKFMSFRAKTIVMNTFCVSRLMNIARHIKVPRTLIEKFQSLSLKALWGEGKKTEVALCHLQRKVDHGGIGWPNLRLKILAAKVIDI